MSTTKRARSARILSCTFDQFVKRVKSFHGYEAVGVIVGGFMVDLAYRHLPKNGQLFDALCETPKCLPDAIQLLTPCTTGNGWLTVINVGRFALTLYDKETGEGVRIFVDPARIEAWPELKAWFFKLKTKKEQDVSRLLDEAKRAGGDICGVERVRVAESIRLRQRHRGEFAVCPVCREAYPLADGGSCLACQGREELYGVHERKAVDR
jgi:formylmethanofuran dehydrogenase subunit E